MQLDKSLIIFFHQVISVQHNSNLHSPLKSITTQKRVLYLPSNYGIHDCLLSLLSASCFGVEAPNL